MLITYSVLNNIHDTIILKILYVFPAFITPAFKPNINPTYFGAVDAN